MLMFQCALNKADSLEMASPLYCIGRPMSSPVNGSILWLYNHLASTMSLFGMFGFRWLIIENTFLHLQCVSPNTCTMFYLHSKGYTHIQPSTSMSSSLHITYSTSLPLPVGMGPLVVVLLLSALEVQLLVGPSFLTDQKSRWDSPCCCRPAPGTTALLFHCSLPHTQSHRHGYLYLPLPHPLPHPPGLGRLFGSSHGMFPFSGVIPSSSSVPFFQAPLQK